MAQTIQNVSDTAFMVAGFRAAEIRAGEILAKMEKNKGRRSQDRPKIGGSDLEPPKNPTPKLSDLGITKKQSSEACIAVGR